MLFDRVSSHKNVVTISISQATVAAQSLCAQYETLTLKYNRRFIRKCSISYIKMLLTPSAIMKFGYVWEVSIDAKMKAIWGVVSKKGGAGTNAEDWAVTGYLRSIALLPLKYAMRKAELSKKIFIKFALSNQIQFHDLSCSGASAAYKTVMKCMFGGNIGTALADAVRTAGYNFQGVDFQALPLHSFQYFEKLKLTSAADSKFFNTNRFDWRVCGRSRRNIACRPRVGSNCLFRHRQDLDDRLIRITVRLLL